MFIMPLYPPVCSCECEVVLHRIVTEIESCYFVGFVKPCLPRKKKGVDDVLSLFFFFLLLSDQYAFCRYMIDMFVHGDLKPGIPNNSCTCLY